MKSPLLFSAGLSPETASYQWIFAKHIAILQAGDYRIVHTAIRHGKNIIFVCWVKRIIQLRLKTICEVKLMLHPKRLIVIMPALIESRVGDSA
jgi:hypothetical protein